MKKMKKLVCLFSCLIGFNLNAMGDDFQSKNQSMLFIICIAKSASTESLQDCPVKSPRKTSCCPVKSPKPKDFCPVLSPKPTKTGKDSSLDEQDYLFLAVSAQTRK